MKLKNLCYCFLIFLLCIEFCSCKEAIEPQHYEVYVCNQESLLTDSDLIKYNSAKQTYTLPEPQFHTKTNMPEKEFLLGSDRIPLKYNQTYNYDLHEYNVDEYTNREYGLSVDYHEKTGDVAYVILGEYKYKIADRPIENNDYLLKVCTSFLSNYVTDLSTYTVSTTSWVQHIDEHGVENDTFDGFRSIQNDNEKIRYTVHFNHCINGIKTSDNIMISVTSDGYLQTMSMLMIGEFNKYSNAKIDIEQCDQLISAEVASLCNIEGYEYKGYTDSKMLVLLDNKLCLLTYVNPKLTSKNGDVHAHTIELLIPISR